MKRLALACVALLGLCLLILHQLGRLEEFSRHLARLRAAVALEKIPRLPESSTVDAIKPEPPAKTKRLEELIRKAGTAMGGIPLLSPEDLFGDYPELETAFLKAMEGHLRTEYGGFFVLAGFSEQQIDRFLEISLSGERDWIALTKEATARGVTLSDPAIKLLAKEQANQRKLAMETLLGPAGLALREKYREERPARNVLMALAKGTASGGQPLTFDQLNRLAALTTEIGVFDNDRPLQALDLFSRASRGASEILTAEQQPLFDLLLDARSAELLRFLHRRQSR